MNKPRSKWCGADLRLNSGDEGTNHYACNACNKACDLESGKCNAIIHAAGLWCANEKNGCILHDPIAKAKVMAEFEKSQKQYMVAHTDGSQAHKLGDPCAKCERIKELAGNSDCKYCGKITTTDPHWSWCPFLKFEKKEEKSAEEKPRCNFCSCSPDEHETSGNRSCKVCIGRCIEYEPPIPSPPPEPKSWEEEFEQRFFRDGVLPISVPGKYLFTEDLKSFIAKIEKEAEERGYESGKLEAETGGEIDWRDTLADLAEKYCTHVTGQEDCLYHELEPIIVSIEKKIPRAWMEKEGYDQGYGEGLIECKTRIAGFDKSGK